MKKILLGVFSVLVLFGLYYFTQDKKIVVQPREFQEINNTPVAPVIYNDKSSDIMVKAPDQNFLEFDKVEAEWLTKMSSLLSENENLFYLDLRTRNDEEKMSAYKEYHEYLRQKHGDNYSYNISEDQTIRERDINTKYAKELLKKIGEQKFKSYLEMKDQFNEKLQKKSPDGNALIIEF